MSDNTNRTIKPIRAGQDSLGGKDRKIWGMIPLAIKVSGRETNGALLVFEHRGMDKGGPPRHVHLAQDEWFYVVEGEFAFEVGEEKFRLKAGDSAFGPRQIPHGWACVGREPGTLIVTLSPVGSFEEFILETTRHASLPPPEEVERAFDENGMKIVGPPLAFD